ncbi:hypothetical protein FAQ01_01880 [Flavobacterium aquatile]|nr:hypothetical protein FAQ01_01880 [Flavobacterium aquatile]
MLTKLKHKMKKIAIITLCFLAGTTVFSQKLLTRNGAVKFEATMPSALEEIAGSNATASCIFNETTGDFVTLVLVKGFKFKSPLMEEHFNENYLESSKFPKSTFKGKVLNFDKSKLTTSKTAYELEGDLTIHGITKKIKTKIYLSKDANKVNAQSDFSVKLSDYNIEIPSLVKDKISKEVKLSTQFILGES